MPDSQEKTGRMKNQRNNTRQLCSLVLALVGLVIGMAVPLTSTNLAASIGQSDSGSISSARAEENPLSLNRWSSNGPDGGAVLSLAIDQSNPATIYAGTATGVFKSTNGAGSWSQSLSPDYISRTHALAIDPVNPNIIYATAYTERGVGVEVLYKSTNGGESWGAFYPFSGLVYSLTIDPSNSNIIYAATSTGVLKSINGAQSWRAINDGLPTQPSGFEDFPIHAGVSALAIDPGNPSIVYASVYDSTGGRGIFKSTNSGASWSEVFNGFSVASFLATFAIDPFNSNTIYAGGYSYDYSGVVLKSTNGGGSWSQFHLTYSVSMLAIDPASPNIIYAGSGGVSRSTDGGQSWR